MFDSIINKILAITKFDNNNYVIYIEEQNVKYAVIKGKKIDHSISINAEKVLDQLYNLIKFDIKNSVFCGTFNINRKKFEIIQDLRSKLYTYILMKDGKRVIPAEEDVMFLNLYYNNEEYAYCDKPKSEFNMVKDRERNRIKSNVKDIIDNETKDRVKNKIECKTEDNINEKNKNKTKKAKKSKPIRFIKKVLKVSGTSLLVFISAGVITYNLPSKTKSEIDYSLGTAFRKDLTKKDKEYSYNDIVNAIEKNNNIPKQEKEFIEELLEEEFEENKQYIDIERLIDRLESFEVEYQKAFAFDEKAGQYESTRTAVIGESTMAYYDNIDNKMVCLEEGGHHVGKWIMEKKDKPFGFNEVDKSTYYHEMNHLCTYFGFDSGMSQIAEDLQCFEENNDNLITNTQLFESVVDDMNVNYNSKFFMETINEIFSQEYVDKYYRNNEDTLRGYGYYDNLPYMYCLAEILPDKVLREYKFNDNDSIITEGLLNIKIIKMKRINY